jgi:predicted transcriptional regulator
MQDYENIIKELKNNSDCLNHEIEIFKKVIQNKDKKITKLSRKKEEYKEKVS